MRVVSSKELARVFGVEKSNARSWLIKASKGAGINILTIREPVRGKQMFVWSEDDAHRLIELREEAGYRIPASRELESELIPAQRASVCG